MEEEEFSSAFSTPSPSRNHSPTLSEENQATPKASKKRKKTTLLTTITSTSTSTTTSPEIKALPLPLFPLDDNLGNYPLLEKFDQPQSKPQPKPQSKPQPGCAIKFQATTPIKYSAQPKPQPGCAIKFQATIPIKYSAQPSHRRNQSPILLWYQSNPD